MAVVYIMAVVDAPIRYTSVAICYYAISIGYAVCPLTPQYWQCLALHLVACNDGNAANSGSLMAIAGIMRAY